MASLVAEGTQAVIVGHCIKYFFYRGLCMGTILCQGEEHIPWHAHVPAAQLFCGADVLCARRILAVAGGCSS